MIGEELRKARRAQDLTLNDVVEVTKIPIQFLTALEEQNYGRIPGTFHQISFQRQYAALVGVDEERAVAAIRASIEESSDRGASISFVREASEVDNPVGGSPGATVRASRVRFNHLARGAVAILLTVVGGYWYFQLNGSSSTAQPVSPETSAEDLLTAVGTEEVQSDGVVAASGVLPVLATDGESAEDEPDRQAARGTSGTPPVDPVAETSASSVPARPEEPVGAGLVAFEAGDRQRMAVEFRAKTEVWMKVLVDGGTSREVFLRPGNVHRIQADGIVQASLGNAGGATLVIDGRVQDPIGRQGQVRHIQITPQGWSPVPPGSF